jgi:multidrug efflux pump subunit AcrA (membrane-fusion protein)
MSDSSAEVPSEDQNQEGSSPDVAEGPSEETIQNFIEAQLEDAKVRERELDIRERELELNKEQAKASIDAQIEDRKHQREHFDRIHQRKQRYGIALIVLVLLFLGFLVYAGEQEIALELIKLAVFGGGGYYAGKKVGATSGEEAEAS